MNCGSRRSRALSSARVPCAGDGVTRSRTFFTASPLGILSRRGQDVSRIFRVSKKSSLRDDAATSTRDACAPQLCSCAAFVHTELNSLCQRQLTRKVDRVRLTPHVVLPAVTATLATAAGLLFPAKRASDFRAAGPCVHVRDAAIASYCAHEFFRFAYIVRKDR